MAGLARAGDESRGRRVSLSPDPLYPLPCSAREACQESQKPSRCSRWRSHPRGRTAARKTVEQCLITQTSSLVRRTALKSPAGAKPTGDLRLEWNSHACRHHAPRPMTFKGTSSRCRGDRRIDRSKIELTCGAVAQ